MVRERLSVRQRMSEILERLQGGEFFGFSQARRGGPRPQAGADLRYNLTISFRDAAKGSEVDLQLPVQALCPECGGSGAEAGTKPETCRQCQGTGYRGRMGIFELMPVTENIRSMILERASSAVVRREAARMGMRSLRQDGLRLVGAGRTTLEEVLRATKDERFAADAAKTQDGD